MALDAENVPQRQARGEEGNAEDQGAVADQTAEESPRGGVKWRELPNSVKGG